MPRIPPSLIWKARSISRLLPLLLPICRDLRLARSELRWLKEHAIKISQGRFVRHDTPELLLEHYVARRARGEPLQYILGSEYFGDLEVKCRPDVLIPRPETAASVTHLVNLLTGRGLLKDGRETLRVLDLCTGTGCIPLLFHHEYYSKPSNSSTVLELVGVDISPKALDLAQENLRIQTEAQASRSGSAAGKAQSLASIRFVHADVLRCEQTEVDQDVERPMGVVETLHHLHRPSSPTTYDILISNPPYISSKAFGTSTARSVRHYEPKLALVPESRSPANTMHDGDIFYPRLLDIAEQLSTQIVLFEVADMEQAKRVASMTVSRGIWDGIEMWCDEPSARVSALEEVTVDGSKVRVRGIGHGRSVFAYRGVGARWLSR